MELLGKETLEKLKNVMSRKAFAKFCEDLAKAEFDVMQAAIRRGGEPALKVILSEIKSRVGLEGE